MVLFSRKTQEEIDNNNETQLLDVTQLLYKLACPFELKMIFLSYFVSSIYATSRS